MARSRQYPPSVKPGIPKLPPLPSGWRYATFGELTQVVKRRAELDDAATYQLVTAKRSRGGIVPRERLTGRQIKTKTQFFCHADDFLISRRQIIHGACGVVPRSLDGAVVSNEYTTLRVNGGLLLPYLEALSHTTYFQRTCFHSSIGVDVEKMIFKLEDWLRCRVPIPPLPEQNRIAAILSSVDEAIQATLAVIEQTRRVKEGLLQDLLTRGIGHTRFKETDIGKIPESWEVRPLGSLCKIRSGGTPSRGNAAYWGGSIPWVKTGQVNYQVINTADEFITQEGIENSAATVFPAGTILMAMYGQGATRGRVGFLGIPAATNQACAAFLDPKVDASYLYQFLVAAYDALRRMGREGTQKNLSAALLKDIPVPVPPREEQEILASKVVVLDKSILQNQETLSRLRKAKDGLLQELLTGKVRVPV